MREDELKVVFSGDLEVCLADLGSSEMVRRVREAAKKGFGKGRHWSEKKGEKLNLRELAFAGEVEQKGLRRFTIVSARELGECGQGAAQVDRSSKGEPLYEYCVAVLDDGTSLEAWTLRAGKDKTYFSVKGKEFGYSENTWSESRLGSWRTQWSLFFGGNLWGVVITGVYLLFDKWFYCKSLVKWNLLKVRRAGAEELPIHLARKDKVRDLFASIYYLATLRFLRKAYV